MTKARLAAFLLLAAGCAGDLPPRSLLQDVRVLALLANPLEVGPDETVTVSADIFTPPGAMGTFTEQWTFCPFTQGPTANDVCAVPQCETALDTLPDGSLSADPGARAQACLQAYGGQGSAGSALPSQVPERLDPIQRSLEIVYSAAIEVLAAPV